MTPVPTSRGPGVRAYRVRPIAATLSSFVFLIPILLLLLTRVPGTTQIAISGETPPARNYAVDIRGTAHVEMDGIFFVHRLSLRTKDVGRLSAHQQIRLAVGTYNTEPDFRDGELLFSGTECRYRTPRGQQFVNNGLLTLVRATGCSPLQGTPTGEITLRLRFHRPAHVALWTLVRQAEDVTTDALIVSSFGIERPPGILIARGTLVDTYPENNATRLELLAYVWELPASRWWIVLGLCVSAALIGGAVFAGWPGAGRATPRGSLRRSGAAFMGALGLATAYAIVVPPFQAADEPSHFLALTTYLERPELDIASARWAERMHFEEIRFHGDRQFSPLDRGRPGEPWKGVGGVGGPRDLRGAGVRGLWALAAPVLRMGTAPPLLIAMRLLHALIFAASVALFVLLVARFTDAPSPELLAIPLFLVPTLPYFGMHISNYAPLLDVYIVLAAGVAIASWDGARAYVAGPILGATLATAIAISRSAVPMASLVASLLLARVVLGDRQGRHGPAWVYWLGFTSMLTGGLALAERTYVGGLESGGATIATSTAWLALVLRRPWLLAVPGAAALGTELTIDYLRRRWAIGRGGTLHTAVRWGALGMAAALLLLFAASLWLPYPTLDPLDPSQPPPARDYVRQAVLAFVTLLRFGRPDHLTSITFWGGFGWLDTILPSPLISLLAASSGVALVLLLVWIGRTGAGRVLVWLGFAAGGFVLSAAVYALSIVRATPADLHGRYLLGLYISFLVIAWSALARMEQSGFIRRPDLLIGGTGLACLAVHTYGIAFILARYF